MHFKCRKSCDVAFPSSVSLPEVFEGGVSFKSVVVSEWTV